MSATKRQYFTSCAAVFNKNGKLLLTKRHHPSKLQIHNHWQLPGGSVDFGEHPRETAIRELFEETGLAIELISDQPLIYAHTFTEMETHVVLFIYIAKAVTEEIDITLDLEETNAAEWYTLEEIKPLTSLPETYTISKAAFSAFNELTME